MDVLYTFLNFPPEVENVTALSCKPFLRTNLFIAQQNKKNNLSLPNLNLPKLLRFFI